MKTFIVCLVTICLSCILSAQTLLYDCKENNTLTLKAGWDQTIVAGLGYAHHVNELFKDRAASFQVEFLSPLATFHQLSNGRVSVGLQTEVYRKSHFGLNLNVFGTYSWTQDVSATIKGIGIYSSIIPALHTDKQWVLALEFAYRPTLFSHYSFSDVSDNTFNDRYPEIGENIELPDRDGWYSFTNHKFQLAFIISKRINTKFQLGMKLGMEHFSNDFHTFLNGWIGQIPLNANVNLSYNF